MKSTLADKYQFVTFALDRMKLSTVQRKKKSKGTGQEGSRQDTKRNWDQQIHRPHSCKRAYCTTVWVTVM